MKIILWILTIRLTVNTAAILMIPSITLGTYIMICACVVMFFISLKWEKIKELTQKGFGKALKICVFAGLLAFCFLCGFILSFAHTDADFTENVIIVPGCGIKRDNTPTRAAIGRLNAAKDYYSKNPDVIIVVCGGYTKEGCISEAESMKNYLVQNGIPPEKIICEDKSLNTRQNFRQALLILQKSGIDYENCALVTNSFHILRAVSYAKDAGFEKIKAISVSTDPVLFLPSVAREACAVAAMYAFNY